MRKDWLADTGLTAIGLVMLVFVLAPVFVVLAVSLSAGESFGVPTGGLSLRWYAEILRDPQWRTAVGNSVTIALISTMAALALGVPAAYAVQRMEFPGRNIIGALAISPMVLPVVALAAAQYLLLARLHLSGTMAAVVIAHVVYVMPFVFVICGLGIASVDPRIEAAAFSLGASRAMVFRTILFPNIFPSMTASALLCFVSSFDELVLALFVGSGVRTVPLTIMGELKYELKPTIAALSTSLSLLTVGMAFVALLMMRRSRISLARLVS